jgi:hypothetical protein
MSEDVKALLERVRKEHAELRAASDKELLELLKVLVRIKFRPKKA